MLRTFFLIAQRPLLGEEGTQVYRFWKRCGERARELSPSRIKNSAHSDGDFHADLLLQGIARKTRGRKKGIGGIGIVEGAQFRAKAGDELGGAKAKGWFVDAPVG